MKAAICTQYGDPSLVKIMDIEKPSPNKNQILLKIHASSVTSGDARIRRADPWVIRLIFGFRRPRKSVLGVVVAGEVEAIGKDVTKFKAGDKLFGTSSMSFGAHAEYLCIEEDGTIAPIPNNMTYSQAASIPFGATAAYYFLLQANIQKNQKVLVYGASGAIGTMAIQLLKEFGAEVTAVCSASNIEMVYSLGADKAIDYTKEDFTKNGVKYDVIFDTVGKNSFSSSMKSLSKNGTMLMASASIGQMIKGCFKSMVGDKKIVSGVIQSSAEDLHYFKKLIESGRLKAVVDRVYSLQEISEAHKYVDTGHKKGNVIIEMYHFS